MSSNDAISRRNDPRLAAAGDPRAAWLALLRRARAVVRRAWSYPRAHRVLMEMPDYLLKDIGFERDGRGTVRRHLRARTFK